LEFIVSDSISKLNSLGQSIWYDNIQRKLIENGELARLIDAGDIRGITSNPSIFHNAIAKTTDYDSFLVPLAWSGKDSESIFWSLAIQDIRDAADLLYPVYLSSNKSDGYVSLEVNPLLANDTENTISQAKSLWARVARPNLMIKIPATPAGIPAIRETLSEGINVNVTLIFSLSRYDEVMVAYLEGLENRVASGLPVDHIASVASFFISRLDTKVDGQLTRLIEARPDQAIQFVSLLGKASISNAKLAFAAFEQKFTSERFSSLRTKSSAQIQRPLWASTSTKNPDYPDTLYVDNLIGPDTVNTMPPQTLDAFRDHGIAESRLTRNLPQAEQYIRELQACDINLDLVTQELEDEGVKSFADAFTALIETIETRRKRAIGQLGLYHDPVARRISRLANENASKRMHEKDPNLWTSDLEGMKEITNRLGWLNSVMIYSPMIPEFNAFRDEIRADGFKRVLLLGMGGSSLAPEVMASVFSHEVENGLAFSILDSTDPAQVLDAATNFPPENTLYIVSSKSGGTAEVNAMFNYFWSLAGQNGKQFIAITDAGTALEQQAINQGFRKVFHGDSTVGGRFSALTPFGLVPAALMGIGVERLLSQADHMVRKCAAQIPAEMNPGLALGAVLGQMTLDGRDKLTIIADKSLAPFGAWLEQLIAESSGKNGKGLVVVDGEKLKLPNEYEQDRLFVYLRMSGEYDAVTVDLFDNGLPVIIIDVNDPYNLGAEFYRWEIATAIACSILEVNAFDQPDVQLSKDITKEKIKQYSEAGRLDEGTLLWTWNQIKVFSPVEIKGTSINEVLSRFISKTRENDFIGINAYLPRNPESMALMAELRLAIGEMSGRATTLGIGPRFLHSTGQLYKGGKNNGVFLQITADPLQDLEIPGQKMSFGTLERAQTLGDYEALVSRGRRIIRLHFPSMEKLRFFVDSLAK
jgi:transaldolase / glucose-6-phosphate isomerase